MLKPRWYVERLGLESKVLPSNVVDEYSRGGLQAYPLVSPFVKFVDNKAIYLPTFLRVHNIE